jgi:transcriptional regulator with XRE-family HTH domain
MLMGRGHRSRPDRLGEKLLLIRTRLGLSQSELIKKLAIKSEVLYPASISLAYSNLSGWTINELVDDRVDLSEGKTKKR